MKRRILLYLLILSSGTNLFAQKMAGLGGELSLLSFGPSANIWISRTTGFEVFAGISSELGSFKANDYQAGLKLLKTIIYNRTDRTYFGIVGKWKRAVVDNVDEYKNIVNFPVAGLVIGKEWYSQRIHLRAYAIELGYQYGRKDYLNTKVMGSIPQTFEEFPLILTFRYTFMKRKN